MLLALPEKMTVNLSNNNFDSTWSVNQLGNALLISGHQIILGDSDFEKELVGYMNTTARAPVRSALGQNSLFARMDGSATDMVDVISSYLTPATSTS